MSISDNFTGERRIGEVWVDSGTVMFVDPCYVLPDERLPKRPNRATYDDMLAEFDKTNHEAPFVNPWGEGKGTIVGTLYGDGSYPLIATYREGRITKIAVDFDPHDEYDDWYGGNE